MSTYIAIPVSAAVHALQLCLHIIGLCKFIPNYISCRYSSVLIAAGLVSCAAGSRDGRHLSLLTSPYHLLFLV